MNRTQRIILVAYFLAIAYCCLWIPLHEYQVLNPDSTVESTSLVYGWLWSADSSQVLAPGIILLRLTTSTTLAGAAYLAAGKMEHQVKLEILDYSFLFPYCVL
jgi:hypothetical protein